MQEEIPITRDENEIANEESRYIYGYLRKKYCNNNVKDLDIILNSLCFSLCRLVKLHVQEGEEKYLIEIIEKIIRKQFEK